MFLPPSSSFYNAGGRTAWFHWLWGYAYISSKPNKSWWQSNRLLPHIQEPWQKRVHKVCRGSHLQQLGRIKYCVLVEWLKCNLHNFFLQSNNIPRMSSASHTFSWHVPTWQTGMSIFPSHDVVLQTTCIYQRVRDFLRWIKYSWTLRSSLNLKLSFEVSCLNS